MSHFSWTLWKRRGTLGDFVRKETRLQLSAKLPRSKPEAKGRRSFLRRISEDPNRMGTSFLVNSHAFKFLDIFSSLHTIAQGFR